MATKATKKTFIARLEGHEFRIQRTTKAAYTYALIVTGIKESWLHEMTEQEAGYPGMYKPEQFAEAERDIKATRDGSYKPWYRSLHRTQAAAEKAGKAWLARAYHTAVVPLEEV